MGKNSQGRSVKYVAGVLGDMAERMRRVTTFLGLLQIVYNCQQLA